MRAQGAPGTRPWELPQTRQGGAALLTPCWWTLAPRAGREFTPVFYASDRRNEQLRETVKAGRPGVLQITGSQRVGHD